MTQQIEKMDLADFEKLPGRRSQGRRSWQRSALAAMEPNTAMIVSHEGIACGRTKVRSGCGLSEMTRSLRNADPSKLWSTRHLKDGRVAVACFPASEPK